MSTHDSVRNAALQPKTRLQGTVMKTTLAGAIIDIGQDVPGVIHISQLQQDPVNKVEDLVRPGQTVIVWVRRVRSDRVELTMIEPRGMDWKDISPEMTVRGKVIRVEPYGAFVDFGAEKPGLVHISEMSRGYLKSTADAVRVGDEVEAKVLSVDQQKRQIRLSMKALQPEIAEEKPRPAARSDRAKSRPPRAERPTVEENPPPTEPEVTAMQLAWQEALERGRAGDKTERAKPPKPASTEREEILSRTLEKRLPTGG